jgi:hypothetical protein
VTEDENEQPLDADGSQESQPEFSAGYDSYRSVADSNLVIFVPKHTVPPFRFKAGGWELLQSSVELNSAEKAGVDEHGFFIIRVNPTSSGELVPSEQIKPAPPSLEVEFALVIASMIESVKNSPQDIRQVIYDLARYKLQEQILQASVEEREHTQQALEGAIRNVEAFSKKHVHILPTDFKPQLSAPAAASTVHNSSSSELVPHVEPRPRLAAERKVSVSEHQHSPWPYLRRTAAMIVILVAILVAVQQREGLLNLAHNLPKLEGKTAVEEPSASSVPAPPPAKSAALRPADYGVYAISDGALIDLSSLPGPNIRMALSLPLTTPSRTILNNGHPKFVVFSRELASSVADRAEVRIIAKVAREFSDKGVGKKPSEDAWIIRNISFPFRSSPVNDNPEMSEIHSEDPALELPPGRYVLVLKTHAYDFSVEGNVVDPRQCIERTIGTTGVFYSNCKES